MRMEPDPAPGVVMIDVVEKQMEGGCEHRPRQIDGEQQRSGGAGHKYSELRSESKNGFYNLSRSIRSSGLTAGPFRTSPPAENREP